MRITTALMTHKTMTTTMKIIIMIFHATFHSSRGANDANVFMERPRNVSSITGRDATMRCRVAGGVMWMKEDKLLGLDDDRELNPYPRYTIVGDVTKGEHHLSIRGVTLEDEGWFTCVGSPGTSSGNGVSKAYLNVVVPPDDPIMEGHSSGSVVTFDGTSTHLVLRCSSGFSKPATRITWRKNGLEFNSNYVQERSSRGGYMESLSNTESVLTFHPTPLDDGASVECLSTHPGSYSNRTAGIRLVVYYPPSRVEILGIREGEPVTSGSSHALTCLSVGGNPLPTLTWRKGNQVVPDQKQIVSNNRVTSKINFSPTPGDDGATLTCEATSHASTSVLTSVKISVYYPPTHVEIQPHVIGRLNAQEGKEILIQCKSGSSNPPAKISWHLTRAECDPEPLRHFTQVQEDIGGGEVSSQLRYLPRTEDHGARIFCRADNPLVGVTVNASVPLDVTYRPRFVEKRNFTVTEGSVVSLSALVDSNPEVHSFTWMRGQQHIGPISSRHPVTFLHNDKRFSGGVKSIMADDKRGHPNGDQSRPTAPGGGRMLQEAWLNISQVLREDAGRYLCQATNSEGRTDIEVTLDVLYPAYITGSRSVPEAVEGASSVSLECSYRGNPVPKTVRWFRNGVEILTEKSADATVSTVDEGLQSGTSTLEYRPVRQEHMGVHRCKVQNGVNDEFELSREMKLIVQHKPKIDKSPIFRKAAGDINGTARLRCKAHGIPHVEFLWFKVNDTLPVGLLRHDNAPVPSDEPAVLVPTNHTYESVIEILNVQARDLGVYYCRAENSLGSDDFQVHLGRPGPPEVPYDLQVVNATHDSITVSWKAGFDGGSRQTFVVRLKEQRDFSTFSSSSHEDSDEEAVVENVTSPLETVVYTVRGLKLGSDYWISVSSFNKYGPNLDPAPKSIQAFTSVTAPVSDHKTLQIEFSILVYALSSLVIVVIIVIIIFCLVKKTRSRPFKDPSRDTRDAKRGTMGTMGNMVGQSKMSSVETTTTNATNATLDLTPSLVDDLNFKTLDSLNSSNVNFVHGNSMDYHGGTMTMIPKYGYGYDGVSQTHSTCDVNKCTEYRPFTDDELFTSGNTRRYQNNFTPTNSLLSASRTKITVNPMHLLPSCVTDATDSIMTNRHQNNRVSDLPTGTTCYVPINSCMTSSAVLPDLHPGACGYRPSNDLYSYNTINQSRNYSPDQHQQQNSPFQPSASSYYGLPPELRGHLV